MVEFQIALKTFVEGPPFFADGLVNFKGVGEKKFHLKRDFHLITLTIFDPMSCHKEYMNTLLTKASYPIGKQEAEYALKFLLIEYYKTEVTGEWKTAPKSQVTENED